MEETTTTTDTTTETTTQTPEPIDAKSNDNGALNGENAESQQDTASSKADKSSEVNENNGALGGEEPQEEAIDWEKITDEEYLSKVQLPDGQKWNDEAMKEYTKLLKEYKVDPKIFSAFVAKDIEMAKARGEKASAEREKASAESKAAFKKAGEEFRKEYSPEQVKEMNRTLAGIKDDVFKTIVSKSPLANNKTMGKMILAYEELYGEGKVRGAKGLGEGGEKTFEEIWTGK